MPKYDIFDPISDLAGLHLPGELTEKWDKIIGKESDPSLLETSDISNVDNKALFPSSGPGFIFFVSYGVYLLTPYEDFKARGILKNPSKDYKAQIIRMGTAGKVFTRLAPQIIMTAAFAYYRDYTKEIKTFAEIFQYPAEDWVHIAEKFWAGGLESFFNENKDYSLYDPMPLKITKLHKPIKS